MDVFDDYALDSPIKETIYKEYPDAKLAQLKSGGNFPYLSRSDEVNLHLQVYYIWTSIRYMLLIYEIKQNSINNIYYFIHLFQIHLRKYDGTPFSASDNIPISE